MIQIPATPSPFVLQLQTYLMAFLAIVVPALAIWIKSQLEANHKATVDASTAANTAAQAIALHSAAASVKLDNIENKVNGAMTALTDKSNKQTADALADKDRQIAALTDRKVNPSET